MLRLACRLILAALLKAGLREQVEIWCDGGMKSGTDVVKMILLGAMPARLSMVST